SVQNVRAVILSIGTELTRGEVVNSNAAWLGEQLTLLGFDVGEHVTVSDEPDAIERAVQDAAQRSDLVVASGGLGPTSDDRTSEAVAHAARVNRVCDEVSLRKIQERWAARGLAMPSSNAKQAYFPEGSRVIPNPIGTAPGFSLSLHRARLFFL